MKVDNPDVLFPALQCIMHIIFFASYVPWLFTSVQLIHTSDPLSLRTPHNKQFYEKEYWQLSTEVNDLMAQNGML